MKRLFFLLAAFALAMLLFSCGQPDVDTERSDDAELSAEPTPISLSQFNVEFVRGERDTEMMLRLKKELPARLIAALSAQGVTVETVNITFGTSAEATAQALSRGSVQLGFLPTSVYCAYADGLCAVASLEQREAERLIGLYFPYAEQNAALLEKLTPVAWGEAFTVEDLVTARWCVPANDETAERYLETLLHREYGISVQDLETVDTYSDLSAREEAGKTANFMIVYGSEAAQNGFYATLENLPLEGETVAVSAADAIVSTEAFRAAMQNALSALCMDESGQEVLALYNNGESVNYHPLDDTAYDTVRYVLLCEEE